MADCSDHPSIGYRLIGKGIAIEEIWNVHRSTISLNADSCPVEAPRKRKAIGAGRVRPEKKRASVRGSRTVLEA
jgi:hypothetical protein